MNRTAIQNKYSQYNFRGCNRINWLAETEFQVSLAKLRRQIKIRVEYFFDFLYSIWSWMGNLSLARVCSSCGFFGALNWYTFNLHMQNIFVYWRQFETKWMVFNWVYALHWIGLDCIALERERECCATVYANEVHFKHLLI